MLAASESIGCAHELATECDDCIACVVHFLGVSIGAPRFERVRRVFAEACTGCGTLCPRQLPMCYVGAAN
jgi:hypothetical protein